MNFQSYKCRGYSEYRKIPFSLSNYCLLCIYLICSRIFSRFCRPSLEIFLFCCWIWPMSCSRKMFPTSLNGNGDQESSPRCLFLSSSLCCILSVGRCEMALPIFCLNRGRSDPLGSCRGPLRRYLPLALFWKHSDSWDIQLLENLKGGSWWLPKPWSWSWLIQNAASPKSK